jgi:nicotinate phosphoribosyltransferase
MRSEMFWLPSLSGREEETGLLVDQYHIDAAYVSWRAGNNPVSTFDLYTRRLPFGGGYLLVAGLELALQLVGAMRFSDQDLAFLKTVRDYDDQFLEELAQFRFTGTMAAISEGEIAFADEPLLQVTAPFREALLLEAALLQIVGVSTLIATKAARIVDAAQGRSIAEFGYRRAQAPYLATRSAYIGGCVSTSFLSAAERFGIPTTGTIPHALIQAFPSEEDAFREVGSALERYSLLLDTYNVEQGIETAIRVALESRARYGHQLVAVRLDSGDILQDSKMVRKALDDARLPEVRVLASSDLDEWRIAQLIADGAPIDGFGVGTSLAVGAGSSERGVDGAALGGVYKLVWVEGGPPPIKVAGSKSTWPGRKQVVRKGSFAGDRIQLADEPVADGEQPLLQPVMRDGSIIDSIMPPLETIRERALARVAELPAVYRRLADPEHHPVDWSPSLLALRDEAVESHQRIVAESG